MTNLIIIGNGFDLAHGYKTSYTDFLHYSMINENVYNKFCKSPIKKFSNNKSEFLLQIEKTTITLDSKLVTSFIDECIDKNWCDVEELYFNLIKQTTNNKSLKNLNTEFYTFKEELYKYLEVATAKKNIIKNYQIFFNKFQSENTLIINFNYTDTVKQYLKSSDNLINIHGQLNDENNQPIFGYSLTSEKYNEYNIERSNVEYKRYMKNRDYIITDSYNRIKKELDKITNGKLNIYILGHSCGLSDQKLLHDIFTHSKISGVSIFKYGSDDDFKAIFDNLNTIIGSEFTKITTARESLFMPQINDSENTKHQFLNLLNNIHIIEYKKRSYGNQLITLK